MPIMCRPLALGLLHLPAETAPGPRRQARISLALHANSHGYALAETLEVDGGAADAATLTATEHLAEQLDAVALVVSGAVDTEGVEAMARRARLLVLAAI